MRELGFFLIGSGIAANGYVLAYFIIALWKRTRKPMSAKKARKKTVESISKQGDIDFALAIDKIKETAGKGGLEIWFSGLSEYVSNRLEMLGYTVNEVEIDGETSHKIKW